MRPAATIAAGSALAGAGGGLSGTDGLTKLAPNDSAKFKAKDKVTGSSLTQHPTSPLSAAASSLLLGGSSPAAAAASKDAPSKSGSEKHVGAALPVTGGPSSLTSPGPAATTTAAVNGATLTKDSALAVAGNPAPTGTADALSAFHSAIRWAKPWEEIKGEATRVCSDFASACTTKDPINANQAMHIAAQNCHLEIVENLLAAKASPNVSNSKGQTPLHMAVEYDFYFVVKVLIDAGAERDAINVEGHKAITGIDGGKTGTQAWDTPVTILRAAVTLDQLNFALDVLEKVVKESPRDIDKAEVVQVGLMKKRGPLTKDSWDHKRFMALVQTI